MPTAQPPRQHNVAPGTQTASFWIDESGTVQTAGRCFVIAAIKTRHADDLQRAVKAVRERHGHYSDEMKFGRIKASNLRVYRDVIHVIEDSDARLAATVVDTATFNPFSREEPHWLTHAKLIGRLVAGTMNRNEISTVAMDVVNTPPGHSMGPVVKRHANGLLRTTAVTTAVSLDSKSNDLLQAADLLAGAVFHHRTPTDSKSETEKTAIARRLALAFGVPDFSQDAREPRLTVQTLGAPAEQNGSPARGRGTRQ